MRVISGSSRPAGDSPGLSGGGGQGAEVGGRVGFQGAVGGPLQADVAVAFGSGGDPAGQVAEVPAGGLRLPRGLLVLVPGCRSRVTVSQSRLPRPRGSRKSR